MLGLPGLIKSIASNSGRWAPFDPSKNELNITLALTEKAKQIEDSQVQDSADGSRKRHHGDSCSCSFRMPAPTPGGA